MNTTSFQKRHIGPNKTDEKQMLDSIGLNSLDGWWIIFQMILI